MYEGNDPRISRSLLNDESLGFSVKSVPRQVRDDISRYARENRLPLNILIEFLRDVLYDQANIEAVSKRLEHTLAKWDPALYRRLGPWRQRKHEFGYYGIWVRIPENGMTTNGENHDPGTATQAP